MGSPPSELPKPPIPYIPGWEFTAQSHVCPGPIPVTVWCCHNSDLERAERNRLSPLERCLQKPPLAGQESSQPPHSFDLRIIHSVRIGDDYNSQVFVVKPSGSHPLPEDKTLVAKVYDPLYLDDHDGKINPFKAANQFYTHEVHAYELLSEMHGRRVPRYYGSYTMDTPTDSSRMRAIRLIIIEYVEGITLLQVHPNGFSRDIRQRIMKTMIGFESTVYHRKDIVLRDLSPRNVMLLETTDLEPSRHLVFVDFASALFNRKLDY